MSVQDHMKIFSTPKVKEHLTLGMLPSTSIPKMLWISTMWLLTTLLKTPSCTKERVMITSQGSGWAL
jgi:hypothetical protein